MIRKYNVGDIFKNKQGESFKIIEKINCDKSVIKFLDEFEYEGVRTNSNIKNGSVKNPYNKAVKGIGYYGEGIRRAKINGVNTKVYICWSRLLERLCEIDKYKNYKNITICKEWLNFQNFADFYLNNKPNIDGIKFELDKDLKQQGVENKVYSPETCIFIPKKVNIFLSKKELKQPNSFTGVTRPYKTSKKFVARVSDFNSGERIYLGIFDTKEEAYESYLVGKNKSIEQVKDYMRNLNIYSEEIIQLIK